MPVGEELFVVESEDVPGLLRGLAELRTQPRPAAGQSQTQGLAVALVARDREELARLVEAALLHLQERPGEPLPGSSTGPMRERIFWTPTPLRGELAFVYPGSGNDFSGMGHTIALRWPGLLLRQDAENHHLARQYVPEAFWFDEQSTPSIKERIFAQVALGSLVTDLLAALGVRPAAALGYSLGESAMLFGLRAWLDRDGMLEAMNASTLFTTDLAGRADAARVLWRFDPEQPVDWYSGIVERPAAEVREALQGLPRVYLQIINTPRECVVGGYRPSVEELARRLGCPLVSVPETTTMHCPVVDVVAGAYRALHRLPTTPPSGVRFYSSAWGSTYESATDRVADAILAQARDTIDFPAVIEQAYRDGVRLFIEPGPGGSCSRMIAAILAGRPHAARSACVPGVDGLAALLRVVALLVSERVPVDLDVLQDRRQRPLLAAGREVVVPVGVEARSASEAIEARSASEGEQESSASHDVPPLRAVPSLALRASCLAPVAAQLTQTAAVHEARCQAHAAYLRLSQSIQHGFADVLAFQGQLFEQVLAGGVNLPVPPAVALDRARCLEFAFGKIGDVLGPDFAVIDTFATRVRLPDEPLMLVDRILTVEGEPLSMTTGRVVTEHDVLPEAWYLDAGRIPTCLAVESGQADLFLSGYLGIDLVTRGLAMYRLLDASVTFHRGLPGPGETIRYDIHIDRFFRQGDTHLFRFRFEGTVNGQPLLTMTDGCAGFFTAADLAAGKGVVQTALQTRSRPGVQADDADILPPMSFETYNERQVDALRSGDLAGCFGPLFEGLPLRKPMQLPTGRLRLVHRVTHLDPAGGRFGIGLIRAEADIHSDDWFLRCHFIDDQVMPGTLMYECCLHTLRIFLMRLGWVGEHDEVVCEPVPGVASRLKCRGQVTAATSVVTYEVIVKERGYRPAPYAIVDALMYADGKAIVDISDMCVQLTGLTRDMVAALWANASFSRRSENGGPQPLFDRRHILAFARGKPSQAYGDRYRPFDDGRFIARLPAPPFSFIDRIMAVAAEPWKMLAGGTAEVEYDVPPDAWYFASQRAAVMPFAVLQEAALQSCGFLSAYMGAALTSPDDLHFRNLGGSAELLRVVTPRTGTLRTHVRARNVSSSAGMIIHDYDFEVRDVAGPLYHGSTTFGFFTPRALAQQVGLRDATPYTPTAEEDATGQRLDFPREAPFPDDQLRMLDRVELFVPAGGPKGLGFIEASKEVRPGEWFFEAHFYQDPVWPGSLGLEALLQLLEVVLAQRWPASWFECNIGKHRWTYRGQVVPTSKQVRVQAIVTSCDDERRELTADGLLSVDGLVIYRMNDFRVRARE
jgi:3-hydroxymyristoyl/3-hydroxydecanoyl-(acyl carrier protein) dehydratase/malonyl CoA-acyl carrier protein transacylase